MQHSDINMSHLCTRLIWTSLSRKPWIVRELSILIDLTGVVALGLRDCRILSICNAHGRCMNQSKKFDSHFSILEVETVEQPSDNSATFNHPKIVSWHLKTCIGIVLWYKNNTSYSCFCLYRAHVECRMTKIVGNKKACVLGSDAQISYVHICVTYNNTF